VSVAYPTLYVEEAIHNEEEETNEGVDYIFYPDTGAYKKYTENLNLGIEIPSFYGIKVRDLNTGRILYYDLMEAPDRLDDKNILIVDDICAKGFTFFFGATALRALGAKRVSLFISHCENSIFKGELLKPSNRSLIDKIYTTDSLLTSWDNNKLIKVGGF